MCAVFKFISDSQVAVAFHADTPLQESGDAVVTDFNAGSGLPSKAAVLGRKVHPKHVGLEFFQSVAPKTETCIGFDIKGEMLLVDAVQFEVSHYGMAGFVEVADQRIVGAMMPVVDFPIVETIGAAHPDNFVEKVGVTARKGSYFVEVVRVEGHAG